MQGFSADELTKGFKELKQVAVDVSNATTIQARRDFSLATGEQKDIDIYQQYILEFNMERWMEALEDHTFETYLVPLSTVDAKEIIRLYEKRDQLEDISDVLVELRKSLQQSMLKFGGTAFVKTSSRSAKDYTEPEELRRVYQDVLALLADTENSRLIALSYASMELLKMRDASQVINIFIRSERIWHDMQLALAQEDKWNEALVVRKWIEIEPDMVSQELFPKTWA